MIDIFLYDDLSEEDKTKVNLLIRNGVGFRYNVLIYSGDGLLDNIVLDYQLIFKSTKGYFYEGITFSPDVPKDIQIYIKDKLERAQSLAAFW